MGYRNVGTRGRALMLGWQGWLACLVLLGGSPASSWAMPLSSQARARLSAGQATLVIVEVDAAETDRIASG